jgi:hypothetical protein
MMWEDPLGTIGAGHVVTVVVSQHLVTESRNRARLSTGMKHTSGLPIKAFIARCNNVHAAVFAYTMRVSLVVRSDADGASSNRSRKSAELCSSSKRAANSASF